MTIDDEIEFLGRIPVLHQLGGAALRILAIGAETQILAAGQVLFTVGDAADCAYVVREGTLSLKSERAGESEVIIGPGTLLGEAALLVENKRPATARALANSAVLRISRAMFLRMLEGYPDAAERLRGLFITRADQWARDIRSVRDVLDDGGDSEEAAPK